MKKISTIKKLQTIKLIDWKHHLVGRDYLKIYHQEKKSLQQNGL